MRIAIIAALPGELKPLVRGWLKLKQLPRGMDLWQRQGGTDEVVAVCAGMGAAAARRAFSAAESGGALDIVFSVGWAGGLNAIGDDEGAHIVSEVIDAQTGERFGLNDSTPPLKLVTTARVTNAAEKRRLAETYGAALVDMEAAAVARLAQIRGIPMLCIKGVSDDAQAQLPDLNRFINASGKLMLGRFLAYVAIRPHFWSSLVALGRRSSRVANALAASIAVLLNTKSLDQLHRTGGL